MGDLGGGALRSAHIWLHLHNAPYAAAHVEPPQLLRGGGVVILAARRRVRGEREVREVARGRERDDRRREVAARDLPSTPRYYPPSVTCGSLSHILSFSLIIGFMLARTLVQWLSHARRKRIVSKLTSQGSRERHTTAPNVNELGPGAKMCPNSGTYRPRRLQNIPFFHTLDFLLN